MSFSWNYLTRRFVLMNYRDFLAVTVIGTWSASKYLEMNANEADDSWTLQRVYTHDESDINYREPGNRTDGAVKREHALRYAAKIKRMRAERERESALDAYNYLKGAELQL
jgi:hypothetical protein